ncbi:hypothetical protein FHR55_000939 [Xanthomonas arboricola]
MIWIAVKAAQSWTPGRRRWRGASITPLANQRAVRRIGPRGSEGAHAMSVHTPALRSAAAALHRSDQSR